MNTRLPGLGPRGEGWVVIQLVLCTIIGIGGLGALAGDGSEPRWGPVALVIGITAILVGGLVAARATWDLRSGLSPFPRPATGAPLVDSGAYRLIRHPIYSGLVLGAIGWGLVTGSVLAVATAVLLFLLFDAKSRLEENWLVGVHPEYRAYQRRAKRFIPWIY